jgi:transposase
VFQVHGVDERGKAVPKKQLKRDQMAAFFAKLPACLIGMEACGSSHHWARKLQGFGHTVRLMAPQSIKPYVKTNKNDVADAEAICEAVARPNMRFMPVKSVEQQAVLSLHRVRQAFCSKHGDILTSPWGRQHDQHQADRSQGAECSHSGGNQSAELHGPGSSAS